MRLLFIILACIAAPGCGRSTTVVPPLKSQSVESLFDELANAGTSDARRDELVTELSGKTFSEVGRLAVKTICESRGGVIHHYHPLTAKPWLEEQCPEEQRVWFAANAIWNSVVAPSWSGSLAKQLAELSLAQGTHCQRSFYLQLLRHGYDEQAKPALVLLAKDESLPWDLRVTAATILVQKADPNAYLGVLIDACDQISEPATRSQQFVWGTELLRGKLSDENAKVFVNYGFNLLEQIDDGYKGYGYFLAMHLGRFVGVNPIRDVQAPFQPDQRLPQYQGKHGLEESFFQDTVNNAKNWWKENQQDFAE